MGNPRKLQEDLSGLAAQMEPPLRPCFLVEEIYVSFEDEQAKLASPCHLINGKDNSPLELYYGGFPAHIGRLTIPGLNTGGVITGLPLPGSSTGGLTFSDFSPQLRRVI